MLKLKQKGCSIALAALFSMANGLVSGATLSEGADFATEVVGDPWDMSNQGDVFPLLWTHNLGMASVADGVMTGSARDSDPHFWLHFPKIPSSILPVNTRQLTIDASRYNQLSFYMWLPESLNPGAHNGRLVWHHGGETVADWDASYSESTMFSVYPGWHLYHFDLANLPTLRGRAWSGQIHGLRIDPCLACATTFKLDWARLTSSQDSSAQYTLQNGKTRLLIDNDAVSTNGDLGVLPASNGVVNLGSLPPGNYHVASISDADYALAERGDAWDMSSTSDLVWGSTNGFSAPTVSANQFGGISSGADPYILLDIPALKPIDAVKYRYLTVDMTLSSLPGQESGMLIWWGSQPATPEHATTFLPTSAGRSTYQIDLGAYPNWQGNIKALRIDPLNGPNAGAGVAVNIHSVRLTSIANFVEPVTYQDAVLTINAKPSMKIISPSFDSGEEYAEAVLGKPWNMTGGDIQKPEFGNMSGWEYTTSVPGLATTGNFFHGVSNPVSNGATEGDPHAFLLYQQNQKPIAADNYRMFGFDLYVAFDASQQSELTTGAMMRLAWKASDTDPGVTSDDIVLMPGLNTYWVDMTKLIYEPASDRTWTGNVTYLRIDPLEFPDPRNFYLGKTRLHALPSGRWVLPITLDLTDAENDPLSVTVKAGAVVLASQGGLTNGRAHFLANLGELAEGEHNLTISVSDGVNTREQAVALPIRKLSLTTPHSEFEKATADRVFNWAEASFPQLLPAGSPSTTQHACLIPGAYARYYSTTGVCLMMTDSLLGVTTPAGGFSYVGQLRDYLGTAVAGGF